MKNALRQPQTILVLGGGSDIAAAIVRELASPALRTVILAGRRPDEMDTGAYGDHVSVVTVPFDATNHSTHRDFVAQVVADHGDLDIVIHAVGQLGVDAADDPVATAALIEVNFAGTASSSLAVAEQLRNQGHGTLIVLSSVAGVRTRASNFVYGATKAGLDAFTTGLDHSLHGSGARVMTVRPGFVRTSMTEGMDEAPFTIDAEAVARAVAGGLKRGSAVVWAPAALQGVFGVLRFAPGFVWRKLDR